MLKGRKIPYMETTGIITDISIDFNTLKPKISLVLNTNDKDTIQKLKNEEKLNIELKNIENVGAMMQMLTFTYQ